MKDETKAVLATIAVIGIFAFLFYAFEVTLNDCINRCEYSNDVPMCTAICYRR